MIDFLLDGFGFEGWNEFKTSAFGALFVSKTVLKTAGVITLLATWADSLFGLSLAFLSAYCVLIIFEWHTGVKAATRKGIPHQSRKVGRMIFKIAVYSVPIYVLHQFAEQTTAPKVLGFELDPFAWLFHVVLFGIIWQLVVSLLENLDTLGFKWAKQLIRIINSKFYSHFGIKNDDRN